MHVCVCACMYVNMHVCMSVCICTGTHAHVCSCMCACARRADVSSQQPKAWSWIGSVSHWAPTFLPLFPELHQLYLAIRKSISSQYAHHNPFFSLWCWFQSCPSVPLHSEMLPTNLTVFLVKGPLLFLSLPIASITLQLSAFSLLIAKASFPWVVNAVLALFWRSPHVRLSHLHASQMHSALNWLSLFPAVNLKLEQATSLCFVMVKSSSCNSTAS